MVMLRARLVFPEGEGHAAWEAHGADLLHGARDGHVLIVVPTDGTPISLELTGCRGVYEAKPPNDCRQHHLRAYNLQVSLDLGPGFYSG